MRHVLTIAAVFSVFAPACASEPSGNDTKSESGTAGDTGPEVCEPPENATPTELTTITITNNRAVPIYVVPYSSFSCNYGQAEIEVGGAPVLWQHAGTYAYTCADLLCGWGCSDGGAMGLIINPGAAAQIEWNGGLWADTPISDACKAEANCPNDPGDTCQVLELVEGEYLARINLSDLCPIPDECMACTDGVCEVFFYEPSPGDIAESFEASAVFPAGVEFVID